MEKPIRILHIVTSMDAGGIENMLMNIYRNIDRTKVQFDFLVHRKEKGFFDDEIISLNGRIHHVQPLSVLKIYSYLKELNHFFKQHNYYKVIHSHISLWSYLVLTIAKKYKIDTRIAHSHESHKSLLEHNFSRIPLVWLLKKSINKPLTHRFACSGEAGRWMFGNKQKITVINNAIDVSKFKFSNIIANDVRSEFNLGDSIVIGHIGNFSKAKNYPFILEVFKAVHRKNDKARLMLIGNNKSNPDVEKKVIELDLKNHVFFTGVRSDIAELLQGIDVFLFPSHNEGLPVTLVEAQAAGLKVFASDAITQEVALTDDIEYLSLNQSAEYWADKILKSMPYDRNDNSAIIKDSGYDIVESAKRLEKFYLKQHED